MTADQIQQKKKQRIDSIKALYDEYAKHTKDAAGHLLVAHVLKDLTDQMRESQTKLGNALARLK